MGVDKNAMETIFVVESVVIYYEHYPFRQQKLMNDPHSLLILSVGDVVGILLPHRIRFY